MNLKMKHVLKNLNIELPFDQITIWSSNSTSGYVPKRIESKFSKRYLYTHVHSSIIHKSQKVEATQVFIDRWMDK